MRPNGTVPELKSTDIPESVACFAYNATHMEASLSEGVLYDQAVSLATSLGLEPILGLDPSGFRGVLISGGSTPNMEYIPGVETYSPTDHVRGITATILESSLGPIQKAYLIDQTTEAASSVIAETPFIKPYKSDVALSLLDAQLVAYDEIRKLKDATNNTGVEKNAFEQAVVESILKHDWHPRRAKIVASAIAAAAELRGAVTKRSQRHSRSLQDS